MKKLFVACLLSSSMVLAAPPASSAAAPARTGPARWDGAGREDGPDKEAMERKVHMALVVGAAEAMELSEADALKLSERLKGFEGKRQAVREAMHESIKTLKAAAEGDQASLGQVDQAIARVLDGRAQMAALDKEMFTALAQGQTPQKRAKLALFLARFGQEMQRMRGGRHGHGE